ncbi:hypothetical protein K814_0100325 [Pseudomonas fluorescens LMG 5329]|uniref:CBM-cenC domain-containing protein n=1 Tax=Pseudomonas fluorescens LMG 5329 TaxID=1324332 RepID=A0A0A1ZAP8_PSEFL|nr:hypothetical protein K814_0100325 [Pseudomonas fluorescens LMG 5329]
MPKKNSTAQAMSAAPAPSTKAITAELPYAIIQYATNNSLLYPLDAAEGTTATLTLPAGSTQVIVHFAIKGQSCATFAPIHVASGNVADIPWQWISTCIGHTVLISYEAVVGGKREESLVLELEIQDVREGDLRESMPEFAHAELEWGTRWLNMFKFKGNETIRVKAWEMIRAGSRLFIVVAGNEQNVPPLFKWVAFDHVVTEEEAHEGYVFEFELLRPWLAGLDDYSSCTCHLGVIWDGCEPDAPVSDVNPLPRNAQDFHQRSTVLLRVDPTPDLLAPAIREAVDCGAAGWLINPTNTVSGAHLVIAYDGMAPGAVVCPHLSGTPGAGSPPFFCHTVQPGETSLVFPVPPSAISANFGKPVTASYTVSFNGLGPWPSPAFTATVLEPTEFPKPYIEEVTAEVLDLHTFNGDATAIVPIWDYAAVGQCVWVWITGTLEDGSTYLFYILMDKPLTAGWLANGVDAPISRAELQKLEDCSDFELHVAVSFDGKCDLKKVSSFDVQTFTIEQENLVLDAPEVLEAVGKQLTIYNARNGMTVRVAYTGISDKHQIQLNVKRADGTSIPLLPLQGDNNRGYVDFPIDRTEVIHASGKTLTINYTVTSACKIQTSKDLDLDVSEPVRLTTPEVAQATPPATPGGILDLRTFGADADIGVPDWWFMLTGQRGWLECSGKLWNGSIHTFKVMDAELITNADVTNGLSRALKRLELDKYETGTELTFVFKLTADGGVDVNKAITFPALKLILRKRLLDETPFDPNGRDWNSWQRGAGATNPADLRRDYGPYPWGNGYWLTNWGYTGTTNPSTQSEILFRVFNNLEPGRLYRFHAWVRDDNGVPNPPLLVLRVNGADITPVITPDTTWYLLEGAFTPSSTTVRLSLNNLRMGSGPGNDFRVTWLRVYEV